MKIKVAAASQRQFKQVPGLLECTFKHEVKASEAQLTYSGPVFPESMWEQILSFFTWTYGECKSESQVRLYVNPDQGIWRAWAMPQEYGSGMTTKEIDTPAGAEQRAQFKESEGWIYFGTVHHHCTTSAFQSGVDKSNETSQDGIHITVGFITKPHKDLHVRFYLSGCEFEPDMSQFWEVGAQAKLMAAQASTYFDVKITPHVQAVRQMGQSRDNVAFPEQWKRNLIRTAAVTTTYYGGGQSYTGHGNAGSQGRGMMTQQRSWQPGDRERRAFKNLTTNLRITGLDDEEMEEVLDGLFTDPHITILCNALKEDFCDLEDLIKEYDQMEIVAITGGQTTMLDHNQQALLEEMRRDQAYTVED